MACAASSLNVQAFKHQALELTSFSNFGTCMGVLDRTIRFKVHVGTSNVRTLGLGYRQFYAYPIAHVHCNVCGVDL